MYLFTFRPKHVAESTFEGTRVLFSRKVEKKGTRFSQAMHLGNSRELTLVFSCSRTTVHLLPRARTNATCFSKVSQTAVGQTNVPKWHLGKWNQRLKPAVCPSCLILSHTQTCLWKPYPAKLQANHSNSLSLSMFCGAPGTALLNTSSRRPRTHQDLKQEPMVSIVRSPHPIAAGLFIQLHNPWYGLANNSCFFVFASFL